MNYLFIKQVEERLINAVVKAAASADEQLTEVVVGVQCDVERMDPLSLLSAADGDGAEHFYWERPDKEEGLVCLGAAATLEAAGEGRFGKVTKQRADLFENAVLSGFGNKADERPTLVGGFAFWDTPISSDPAWKGFPAARLMLPELVYRNSHERSTFSVYCKVRPGADKKHLLQTLRVKLTKLACAMSPKKQSVPPPMAGSLVVNDASAEHYLKVTNAALEAISSGDIRKVVVARSREVAFEENIDTIRVLELLRRTYRSCFIFSISEGSSVFLGASPERIASLENNTVRSGPLAGSIGRGQNPAEDEHLARGLATCPKELNEHAIVVHAVRDALSPLCDHLDIPSRPVVMKLPGVQHLHSPIEGKLASNSTRSVVEILERLHPTPAVAGSPRKNALQWLARFEELERGWYSGTVGWINDRGEGDFAIALRSALICDKRAIVHAGAGIVSGSIPEAELRETEMKMNAALSVLIKA